MVRITLFGVVALVDMRQEAAKRKRSGILFAPTVVISSAMSYKTKQ